MSETVIVALPIPEILTRSIDQLMHKEERK